MSTEAILRQACGLLNIQRVAVGSAAMRRDGMSETTISAVMGRELWFGPDGDVIGFWTPEEGLERLRRVAKAEAQRRAR